MRSIEIYGFDHGKRVKMVGFCVKGDFLFGGGCEVAV
jgi:hypothetical protein